MSAFHVADQPYDRATMLKRRQQFAVVNVEHLGGRAQHLGRLLHLGRPPLRQLTAGHLPMADVAVGDRDQLHVMPLPCPQDAGAARLELRVVRVRSETR